MSFKVNSPKEPLFTSLVSRTNAILDYGEQIQCALNINHNHSFGRKFQVCEFRICRTKKTDYVHLVVIFNHSIGKPDIL